MAIVVFCATGLVLRLVGLHRGMWEDEITSAYYTQIGVQNVISTLAQNGAHPPLYFLAAAAEARVGMDALLAIRLPSLVAGVATIPIVYLIALRIGGRTAALIAGALATVAPLAVWYSDEGRMYALVWFLVLASYLCLVWADASPRWPIFAVLYPILVGLALWTDYSAALALLPQPLLILMLRHRAWFLAAWAAGWLSLVPWLVFLREQYGRIQAQAFAGQSWSTVMLDLASVRADYASLAFTLPESATVVLALLAAGAAAALLIASFRGHAPAGAVVLCLTVGALAVALALQRAGVQAVILARVTGVITFGLILLVALGAGLVAASRSRTARVVAAVCGVVVVGCVSASTTDVISNGSNGVHWEHIAGTIQSSARPGDELIYYPVGAKFAVDPYLAHSSPWRTDFNGTWPKNDTTLQRDFAAWTSGKPHVWFVFYAISGVNMPKNDVWFSQHGLCRVMGDPARSMGLIEYEPSPAPC